MIKHSILVIRQAVVVLNRNQVPVIALDRPFVCDCKANPIKILVKIILFEYLVSFLR